MQMVQKVMDAQRRIYEGGREIKTCLGRLESEVPAFLAEQPVHLDRFSDRLERIERRLEWRKQRGRL